MAFRFRKRVKVAPGIYLNLSRRGISTTIGPRGASINFGPDGAFLNTGIPGTGLYRRDRLGGGRSSSPSNPVSSNESPGEIASSELKTSEGLGPVLELLKEAREELQQLTAERSDQQKEFDRKKRKADRVENNWFFRLFSSSDSRARLKEELVELEAYLQDLDEQLADAPADINTHIDDDLRDKYQAVVEGFNTFCKSANIWDVTAEEANHPASKSSATSSVTHVPVKCQTANIHYIRSEYPALHFQNANGGQLFLYPAFLLVLSTNQEITLVDIRELKFICRRLRFISGSTAIPSDAEVIDHTWQHVNKNGEPDRRYSYNPRLNVLSYSEINFSSGTGLNESYHGSSYNKALPFGGALKEYLSGFTASGPSPVSSDLSRTAFDKIKTVSDKFAAQFNRMENDAGLHDKIQRVVDFQGLEKTPVNEKLNILSTIDIIRCFQLAGGDPLNLRTKEGFGMLYLFMKKASPDIQVDYANYEQVYGEDLIKTTVGLYESMKNLFAVDKPDSELFPMARVLRAHDKDQYEEYLANLYRFASAVIKADGTVTPKEEDALKRIMNNKSETETQVKPANDNADGITSTTPAPLKTEDLESLLSELDGMIGLEAVKAEIKTLINFIRIQQAREQKGLKSTSVSYHIVFTGNPGTGKTTVARLLARIYKALGVISGGQLVETDRSGLVAEYLGQTAVKVNKTVDSALNGILFIDEAYSLVAEGQDSFGKEAVATLIKRMEDDRARLIVILAGYTAEMEKFIDSNPGFKSRFNRYIEFPDYVPDELLAMFHRLCKLSDYRLAPEAEIRIQEKFKAAFDARDRSFGNGRFVRNTFEKAMQLQANRIASVADLNDEVLTTIVVDDIP